MIGTADFDLDKLRSQFDSNGYVVLRHFASKTLQKLVNNYRAAADKAAWVEGDQSGHSWKELPYSFRRDIPNLLRLRLVETVVGREMIGITAWINVYRQGQYIDQHTDAAGDAHLLVLISNPNVSVGGVLWIGQPDVTIDLAEGDACLFRASRLPHGTTPFTEKLVERCTLNIRCWTD